MKNTYKDTGIDMAAVSIIFLLPLLPVIMGGYFDCIWIALVGLPLAILGSTAILIWAVSR